MEEIVQNKAKKIYVIGPLVLNEETIPIAEGANRVLMSIGAQYGVEVHAPFIEKGPSSIENELDDAVCLAETVRLGLSAHEEGAAGLIINCMCDPGVKALRCALDIPVVGPAETAFHLAASLGHRFSIIDVGDDTGPMVEAQVYGYGLSSKLASVRGTGVGVEEIHSGDDLFDIMGASAVAAVRKDRADVIVLGCTGFIGCADAVSAYLEKNDITGVPVIDPLPLALRTLIGIVHEGHCHSKRAFPTPTEKKQLFGARKNDPLLMFYDKA